MVHLPRRRLQSTLLPARRAATRTKAAVRSDSTTASLLLESAVAWLTAGRRLSVQDVTRVDQLRSRILRSAPITLSSPDDE